jgi:hypothetical protein
MSFESNSGLARIKSEAFSFSSLQSIGIPRHIEILGSSCFSWCKSPSSVSFELNSRLTRIESGAFSSSLLQWIENPRAVGFIDGSAFIGCKLDSISIEAGHDRFVIEKDFLINIVDHRLIRIFSSSCHIEIMNTIEILGSSCFFPCQSLSLISFDSNSRLK